MLPKEWPVVAVIVNNATNVAAHIHFCRQRAARIWPALSSRPV